MTVRQREIVWREDDRRIRDRGKRREGGASKGGEGERQQRGSSTTLSS